MPAADFPHLLESRIASEQLFKGTFLHAFRDQVRLPDGTQSAREYVVHPGAVMVVPLLQDASGLRVVLVRQFRYPLGKVMIEFPAGKLDAGESPLHCAQRELLEETGYTVTEWARAGRIHPVLAYSTEFIEVWFARGLKPGKQQLDTGEFVEVFTASPQELLRWCLQGQITDAKTMAGAMWLQNWQAGTFTLDWQSGSEPKAPQGGI